MNYFASGLENGLRIGADAYQRRKDREQQSALDKARRDLELERDLKRGQLERDLQGERISADAKKQFNQNFFAAGERDAQNRYGTGERIGSQDFTAGQNAAQRALQKEHTDRTLNQAAEQFTKRLDFDQQNMGLGAGLKARELETRNDPDGMNAQLNAERLKKLKRENADNETVTPGVTPGGAAAPRKALTAQDSAALAWAKANPNSPQAKQILERLGVK